MSENDKFETNSTNTCIDSKVGENDRSTNNRYEIVVLKDG